MAREDSMRTPAARADTRLTYDDFVLFPDDGKRHEIIDGEHHVTPAPNRRHQKLSGRLYFAIEQFLRVHPGLGEIYYAPFDVVLSFHDVVEPDLVFIAADQTEILTEKHVKGPPALVIEILSESTRKRDAQIKRRLFERAGVREYWLVDPELDTVQVFRPEDGRLVRAAELTAEDDQTLATPLLPGCQIGLRDLFRE